MKKKLKFKKVAKFPEGGQSYGNAAVIMSQGLNSASTTKNNGGNGYAQANAGLDSAAGTIFPWYAIANQASNIGQSMVPSDENGNAITDEGATAKRQMTSLHKQGFNSLQKGNYGMAAANFSGIGNLMSMYRTIDDGSKLGKWNAKQLDKDAQYAEGGIVCHECGGMHEYAKGGAHWIQHAVNPKHKGYCTPMTKSTCTPHRKALAMTFKKHHGFHKHEMGGTQYELSPMMYPDGGVHDGIPTAEVEKEELMRMPNGATAQVDGPSHEQGGVPVNIPNGTQIYSDRLKDPDTKKTFAKLAERYKTNKEDKVLKDNSASSLARNTAQINLELKQRKLSEIFAKQEALKQSKVDKYISKLGMNPHEFRNGGTKLTQYAGERPYEVSGIVDENGNTVGQGFNILNNSNNADNESYDPFNTARTNDLAASNAIANMGKKSTNGNPSYKPSGVDYAMMASNLAGPIYNLATNKKPKPFSYVTPTYQKYDPSAELAEAERQNRVAKYLARQNSGGNSAAYLSTLPLLQTTLTANKQNVLGKAQNINTQYFNQLQPTIAGIKNQNIDAMQADIARYRDINRDAVANLGENTSASMRSYKLGHNDYNSANMMSQLYKYYKWDMSDPKNPKLIHKDSGEVLS
jgi:hypothetical protein